MNFYRLNEYARKNFNFTLDYNNQKFDVEMEAGYVYELPEVFTVYALAENNIILRCDLQGKILAPHNVLDATSEVFEQGFAFEQPKFISWSIWEIENLLKEDEEESN